MPATSPTLTVWKKLYQAADEFVTAKCWEHIDSDYIFGVRLPGAVTRCCGVLGYYGETYGLVVYRDSASYQRLMQEDPDQRDSFRFVDAVVMYLSAKAELDAEDRRLVEKIGYKPAARGKWPQFRSMRPGYHPWFLEKDEAALITVCLQQATEVALLAAGVPSLLAPDRRGRILVRAAEERKGLLVWDNLREQMAARADEEQPLFSPLPDQLKLRRLANSRPKHGGTWEADFFFSPAPIQDEPDERPYYPFCLMVLDAESELIIGQRLARHGEAPGGLADLCLQAMIDTGTVPARIKVERAEARAALAPLARELGCTLESVGKLKAIQEARRGLEEFLLGKFPGENR